MIINKIANTLTFNGKKETGERVLKGIFKKIQKTSKKSSKKIIQQALINTMPSFKINQIITKKKKKKRIKEIPSFIKKTKYKIAYAIKLLFLNSKKTTLKTVDHIKKEILESSKNEGVIIDTKVELQKKVLTNRHFLLYYRW